MRYRENGDLERMQRFWFTGACEPRKRRRTSSKPLALAQFMSAFLLLGIGITIAGGLLLCEKAYFGYINRYLAGATNPSWCKLISLSIAESLSHKSNPKSKKQNKTENENDSNNDTDNETLCDNTEEPNEGVRNRKVPTLSRVLGQEKKEQPSTLATSHAHQDGKRCLDPLCEMSFTAVTRELDVCNKQIEILQEALLMKDKSRTVRFPLSNQFTNTFCEENNSANGSTRNQSEDDENIKGDIDHKSNLLNDERNSSSFFIQDVKNNSGRIRQSMLQKSTQIHQKHVQNSSISEIETVL